MYSYYYPDVITNLELARMIDGFGPTGGVIIRPCARACARGGLLRGYSDDLALDLAREKLANTTEAGADCIATLCPFCFVALDIGQMQVISKFQETYDLPVLHYSELLALALGIDPKELALQTHKIKTDKVLNKIF